jgi:hypothetical protein
MIDLYLFKTAIKDLIRAKRLIVAVLLLLLPAAFALLWRYTAPEEFDAYDAYNTLSPVLVFGFLLVILAVVFGTGVITQEMEQKTIVYMLTRPVQRWRIILAKFVAAVVGIVATTSLSSLLLAGAVFGMGGAQTSSLLRVSDLKDSAALVAHFKEKDSPISTYLAGSMWQARRRLPFPARKFNQRLDLESIDTSKPLSEGVERNVIRRLNSVLRSDKVLYEKDRFAGVELRPETSTLLASNPSGREKVRLNRLLLEDAFSAEITARKPSTVHIPRDLGILCVGAMAYGAVFLLLATLLNRPLMFGLVFAFGWETWVPNMPGKFQLVSIMTYLRILAPHQRPPAESVDLIQFLSGGNQDVITNATAWGTLIGVISVALLAALFIFSVNEYVPREDAE